MIEVRQYEKKCYSNKVHVNFATGLPLLENDITTWFTLCVTVSHTRLAVDTFNALFYLIICWLLPPTNIHFINQSFLLHSVSIIFMAVRQSEGFRRYALSIQYHGGPFLGFSYQGIAENALQSDGTDLRGIHSVSGRVRQALDRFLGRQNYENIQVSSRTDRGVHALYNTFHMDVKPHCERLGDKHLDPLALMRGLNEQIRKLENSNPYTRKHIGRNTPPPLTRVRLLHAKFAPEKMRNAFAAQDPKQPEYCDWNARFSATSRTYIYRILLVQDYDFFGLSFDADQAWRVQGPLNMEDMKLAACSMVGHHDFSSFRSNGCQRCSPEVTIQDIQIHSEPYSIAGIQYSGNNSTTQLVTITITGNSFLYRQVRNMVGCLVSVGKGKLSCEGAHHMLKQRNRSSVPVAAPSYGLYLANVQHGDFEL